MNAARSARERKAVVDEMCRMYAFSSAKAYKVLQENGWESGRKKRRDAGTTSLAEEHLQTVAAMLKQCIRKNGKATLPVNVARSILQARGHDIQISDSRLRELLRQNHMAASDRKVPTPHQAMRTEYPNQVHFTDPSVALIWFAPGGKQKLIGDDELYKNKNFFGRGADEKLKCWRYVLTDHYSGSLCVRYYAALGETAANMYDFLLYCWRQKKNNVNVFHGLPELLIWDCGTANIARATVNALQALGVKTVPHIPGNPRAKGQVEGANNIVETHFECRLRFEPVASMEELNDAAERWYEGYNANLIAGLDTRLKRGGVNRSRANLWQRIPKEKLRELPDEETCRQIFANSIQTRKIAGDLTIGIVHPRVGRSLRYSVRDLPGVLVGMEVRVQPLLVTAEPLCIVSYEAQGKETSFEIAPIVYDDAGFETTAALYGQEYKRPKDTARETAGKALDEIGLEGVMGPAHSFIQPANPFIRQQTGAATEVAESVHTHEIIISAVEAAKRVKAACGEIEEGFLAEVRQQYPEGVSTRVVDEWVKARRPGTGTEINAQDWVLSGGGTVAREVESAEVSEQKNKIAEGA
jgi:hypothetical protein